MQLESPFSPDSVPSDPNTQLSRITSINFAATCIAADLFSYVGAETANTRREVVFIFEDPDGLVPEYQRRYAQGVFPHKVNPKVLMDARAFLTREMNRVQDGARSGQL